MGDWNRENARLQRLRAFRIELVDMLEGDEPNGAQSQILSNIDAELLRRQEDLNSTKGDKMRIITTKEVEWAHDENKIGLLESCMMYGCARRDGFELLSDFSGNIFFKHKGVTKPYNICIPELKCVHDNMMDEVEK